MRDADELAVVDAVNAVAHGADLAVDLEAAAEGGAVVRGEESEVLPGVGGGVEGIVVAPGGGGGAEDGERRGGSRGGSQGEALVVLGELTAVGGGEVREEACRSMAAVGAAAWLARGSVRRSE